jgi:hypothetical protein
MEIGNRIILTNESPNDKGGIIRNNSIDWTRFTANPVMLYHHGRDPEVRDVPIGHWADLMFDGVNYSAIPVFSETCPSWIVTLYSEGNLKAASIGGVCIKKTTGKTITNRDGERVPELKLTSDGYWESEYFLTYEASITAIGSNAKALQMNSAYLYQAEEVLNEAELLTFNSNYMSKKNENDNKTTEVEETELTAKPTEVIINEEPKADQPVTVETVILESEQLKIVNAMSGMFEKTMNTIKDLFAAAPHKEPDGDEPIKVTDLPERELPSEVQAEAAIAEKVEVCKTESELAAELPLVIKEIINNDSPIKLSEQMPELKTKEELASEGLQLADKTIVKVGNAAVPSYTEMRSTEEGRKVINRVGDAGGKANNIEDHRVVLQSILNDPKYKEIVKVLTFSDGSANRTIPKAKLTDLAARFESGNVDVMNFGKGKLMNYTELDSTDNLLASPDLIAVEWLNIFLYKLFPSAAWKSEIPVFAAQSTGKNKGLIYANITADPTIYQGSRPVNPANYEYTDDAVSLTLSSFYMQPLVWQPLVMQMLRYDQQSTGWAQAMAKFNAAIDNYLIYTLASQINAVATPTVVKTKSGSFAIVTGDIDSFVLNPAFTGSLAKPTLTDLLILEQVFKKQNYVDGTKFVVVQDPTMDRYITGSEDAKSLLTRFVNSEGDELVGYKNAKLRTRSQVALYNPATSGVIDPSGAVPAAAVSCGLAFVPDQVGIGMSNLDVFMIQDPTVYGYKMSADIRAGASIMRKNAYGTALYTYGEPV